MNLSQMLWVAIIYGLACFLAGGLMAVAFYPSLARRPKHGAGRGSPARKEVVYTDTSTPLRRR